MLGYCDTGKVASATEPISTITMASTLASTGRSMKNLEIMTPYRPALVGRSLEGRRLGRDLAPRHGATARRQHDAIVGRQTTGDHPEIANQQLACLDALLVDDVVLVDHQDVLARLVFGHGPVGYGQDVRCAQPHGDAHPHKEARQEIAVGVVEKATDLDRAGGRVDL